MISYRRLAPVSLVDPLLVHTDAVVELRLPAYTCPEASSSSSAKRASMQAEHELIFTHQLFPAIPPGITATDLPPEVWLTATPCDSARRMWCEHVASDHYAAYSDRRSPLELNGEAHLRDGLGIFGRSCNPLDSVVAFSSSINDTNVLMHYMAVVVLQYYLVKRGGFMRVRTDTADFSDALPPFVFVMFREADCRMPSAKRSVVVRPDDGVTYENAEELVAALSFPAFLLRVFRWMQRKYSAFTTGVDPFKDFCEIKLHKNWIQFLNCMRFREFFAEGWADKIAQSRARAVSIPAAGVVPKHKKSKFFQHPNACQLLSLDASSVRPAAALALIPYLFTHNAFRPDEPIMCETEADSSDSYTEIEQQRMLIYRLMQFSPLLAFNKQTQPMITAKWTAMAALAQQHQSTRVFPTDAAQKWAEYDGYIRPARAHYSFYVPLANKGTDAFLMVPNLHLPLNVPVVDNDTDMRNMSPEAFEWCCTHGTAFATLHDALLMGIELGRLAESEAESEAFPIQAGWSTAGPGWNLFLAWVVRSELELGADEPRNPYMLMLAVQLLTGREEDGVATAALTFGYMREHLQSSYEEMVNTTLADTQEQRESDPALLEAMDEAKVAWDRCSPMPFPEQRLQHSLQRDRLWYFHFPISHVALRGADGVVAPWIEHFQMRNRLLRTMGKLKQIAGLFNSSILLEELVAAAGASEIPIATMQQLRAIYSHFLVPNTAISRAMRVVCSYGSHSDEMKAAGEAAKAAIQHAPVAFQPVMEEVRRLVHWDMCADGTGVRDDTMRTVEVMMVKAIGDPDQVKECIERVWAPYHQLRMAVLSRQLSTHEASEAYAAEQLRPTSDPIRG
jgi:hypothetical protein